MSLGNQWRIQGDGDTWPALSNCFNTAAKLRQYSGLVPEFCAGQAECYPGWNDPDLIAGPNVHADGAYITDEQARTQFSVWSVIAAPLLITNNLLEASEYYFETIGNEEIIAGKFGLSL
jgi:alpha-galactosidase